RRAIRGRLRSRLSCRPAALADKAGPVLGRWRLGLIPQGDGGELRVRAFVEAMTSALEIGIDLHQAADYRALVSALDQGLVHFAWLPPLSAARAARSGRIVPAAVAGRRGATS